MGLAAGAGVPVEAECGYGGLRGWSVPAWGWLVADGARLRRRLKLPWKHGRSLAQYWRTIGMVAKRAMPGGGP